MALFGGIELGGTKVICAVGTAADAILATDRTPTSTPDVTLDWAVDRLKSFEEEFGPLAAIGIASFGPIELRPDEPAYGRLLATPKLAWAGASVVDPIANVFDIPIGLASDVEGAGIAEGISGAAAGIDLFAYMTVGTGVGVGIISGGRPLRGVIHPEIGHIGVRRLAGDTFPGICPFHGDCLEGMACGPAVGARWKMPAEQLAGAQLEEAIEIEAHYLAEGLRSIVFSYAPQRIVIGGGVGLTPGVVPRVHQFLIAALGGYPGLDLFADDGYVAAASLGGLAGPAGTLALAQQALEQSGT